MYKLLETWAKLTDLYTRVVKYLTECVCNPLFFAHDRPVVMTSLCTAFTAAKTGVKNCFRTVYTGSITTSTIYINKFSYCLVGSKTVQRSAA
jgi:hypothetical protein